MANGQPWFSVDRLRAFWQRTSEGLNAQQLWSQLRRETRTSLDLYSAETGRNLREEWSARKRRRVISAVAGAMYKRLTPVRRLLFIVAVVMLLFPSFQNVHGYGERVIFNSTVSALILLALLVFELADRVGLKRDLEIAKDIQRMLLPEKPPALLGLDIAFGTKAANTVAGDYYDVFPRPGKTPDQNRVVLAVADVAGKSIPAAILMATFQASLKTLSTAQVALPELVANMNRYACSNSQGGLRFTTAFLAEYDPVRRTLDYVNAGHNQPILRRSNGSIERLDVGGLPLGIQPEAKYASASVTLAPSDWLLIFTDGLVEAENAPQEEYGESRVLSTIAASATLTPSEMLKRLMTELDLFVGQTPQHDDVTLMLLKAE